jgi:hypothetical protein
LGLISLGAGKLMKSLYFGSIRDMSNLAALFSGTFKQAGVSEEHLADFKQGFVTGAVNAFNLKFGPDGQFLFCATSRGLVVLEWDKVLAAERSTPDPLFTASPLPSEPPEQQPTENDYKNFVYDLVYDEKAKRVLFAGNEGTVRFLNLSDGSTGFLLKPPAREFITTLQLSRDREFIYCYCVPSRHEGPERPHRMRIWNYRLLREAAGLN